MFESYVFSEYLYCDLKNQFPYNYRVKFSSKNISNIYLLSKSWLLISNFLYFLQELNQKDSELTRGCSVHLKLYLY